MNLQLENRGFRKVSDIEIPDTFFNRIKTNIEPLDLIFGEGILPGSTITLKAKPGVGKSIFALTLGEILTNLNYKIGYSSGEEDDRQLAYNCKRLNVQNLQIGNLTDVDELLEAMNDLDLVIIDSFQTLTTTQELSSRAKVKYFNDNLVRKSKECDCSTLFIVQELPDGMIRGGNSLLYAVDVNIEILKNKDEPDKRFFNVYKNRFGATMLHEANFSRTGYEFLGEYIETEEAKEENKKKVSVKISRKETILQMDEPPLITVNRVMERLDIQEATAKLLLTELENDMKIIKYGRGKDAIWKFASVNI
jgi:predicted ATP-dependent serine protease